jgi:xanthine dehydrogenase small subunit
MPEQIPADPPLEFTCNGEAVSVAAPPGASLLVVLREHLGLRAAKDGCAPQGQCGCCTVLVDGAPRVACVTPASRVRGRSVTTLEGLDPAVRDAVADAFVATGGSQCGFCTPGIIMRTIGLADEGEPDAAAVDRALAAHLCRCTGWITIHESLRTAPTPRSGASDVREAHVPNAKTGGGGGLGARRAALEGGVGQRVDRSVALGGGGFADDRAPAGALVAVPLPPGSGADALDAAGLRWVVGETLAEARAAAGKVQGRRTTVADTPPFDIPDAPPGGVALATSWLEPAYLEPDASWCEPGGEPASPLANGGAFGGKTTSAAPHAARELADRLGRAVRVVYSREDCVRLGPKRPPIAATALLDGDRVVVAGTTAGDPRWYDAPTPYRTAVDATWTHRALVGPAVSDALRGVGWAETAVLVEGALAQAGADRAALVADARAGAALLDTCVRAPSDALAGARVALDPATGALASVAVHVAAGDPLDEVELRSYAIGAVHMALGWVLSEAIAVDPETGEVHDLTIRSFGILPARAMPPVVVTLLDDPGPPLGRASDAVFGAVAGAAWNAIAAADGHRPPTFPARASRAARSVRR